MSKVNQNPLPLWAILACALCTGLFSNLALGQSNEGTEFWFGFMEHRDINQNKKVVMITSKSDASGTVSIPLRDWQKTFSVKAHQVTIVELPAFAEHFGSEKIDSKAVRVRADVPVSVYIHQYFGMRSEATMVLPSEALGKEYFVMSYNGINIQNGRYPSEFLIVGTKDETNITLTYSDNTVSGRSKNQDQHIVLNAGQSYQVQAQHAHGDLTGTHIKGDQAFNVFGGAQWTEVPTGCGFRDNLLEQMYPVSTWGKQFVSVPNQNANFDIFRILAAEDDTEISVQSSSTLSYHLDRGEFVEFRLSEASFIQADKGILVAQYNVGQTCNGHGLGDPSMLLLNSIEQTRDTVTLYNSRFQNIQENYINIITASDDMAFTYLDGQVLTDLGQPQAIGAGGDYSFLSLSVSHGSHTIISQGCGVIASAYGYGDLESYAYGGGASFHKINTNPIPEGGCLSDSILFDSGLPESRFSFQWSLSDGTTTDEAVFRHRFSEVGQYPVQLILHDHCLDLIDTVHRQVAVTLRQAVSVSDEQLICLGDPLKLEATDLANARYEWTGPNHFFSELQAPYFVSVNEQIAGQYAVVGIVSGCATFPAYTEVEILPPPEPTFGTDSIFCDKEVVPSLDPGSFHSYHWQDGSSAPSHQIHDEGTYAVTVTDYHGCQGSTEMFLHKICPTRIYIPNAFSPNGDGINDGFGPLGQDFIHLRLSIFNRWGTLLFVSEDIDYQWDGRYKGALVSPGVYVWQLEIEGYSEEGSMQTEVRTGSVTVVR
ncbi:MAG: gliding motility-associated C-terminal domain-containing protein [Bacteroidota bacterium]